MDNRSTKQLLKLFKQTLLDASKLYKITPSEVGSSQFNYIGKGKIHHEKLRYIASFAQLRNFYFPAAKKTKAEDASIAAIRRLLEKAA